MSKFILVSFISTVLCGQVIGEELTGRVSVTDKEIIERLTRLETRIETLDKRIDDLNTGISKRIDDLRDTMLWGFGILFTMIIALFGYIVWDRRTAIMPVVRRTEELKESNALILRILKEYASKEPKLAEILKSLGVI